MALPRFALVAAKNLHAAPQTLNRDLLIGEKCPHRPLVVLDLEQIRARGATCHGGHRRTGCGRRKTGDPAPKTTR